MSFIKMIPPDEATRELARLYTFWQKKLGLVPNIIQAMSLRPDVLTVQSKYSRSIIFGASDIGLRREEMIATLISDLVRCTF